MAKLYWRIKVDGKWTWRPANCNFCKVHLKEYVCGECCYINTGEEKWTKHGGSVTAVRRTILPPVVVGLVDQHLMLASRTEWCILNQGGKYSSGAQAYQTLLKRGNEMSRYGCWKIFECRNCGHRQIRYAKRPGCELCSNARHKQAMIVVGWIVWNQKRNTRKDAQRSLAWIYSISWDRCVSTHSYFEELSGQNQYILFTRWNWGGVSDAAVITGILWSLWITMKQNHFWVGCRRQDLNKISMHSWDKTKDSRFRWKARRIRSGTLVPVSLDSESGLAVNCEARGANNIFIDFLLWSIFYGRSMERHE